MGATQALSGRNARATIGTAEAPVRQRAAGQGQAGSGLNQIGIEPDRGRNSRASDGSDDPGPDLLTRDTPMVLLELAWLRMSVTGPWELVQ